LKTEVKPHFHLKHVYHVRCRNPEVCSSWLL